MHVDVGTLVCHTLNTDFNDSVEKIKGSDLEIISPTTALKIPIISEISINVCEVCIRSSEESKVKGVTDGLDEKNVEVTKKYPAVALINSEKAVEPGTDLNNVPGPRNRAGGCHLADLVAGILSVAAPGLVCPEEPSYGPYETDEHPVNILPEKNAAASSGTSNARHCNPPKAVLYVASLHD